MTELKDKIQEIFDELQNLREEVMAGQSGRQDDVTRQDHGLYVKQPYEMQM